ncbi:hypothetical protein C0J52_03346 [Blattella germanica]|nr:hypothetical protein C0J52_03346 [Blattella germanica]
MIVSPLPDTQTFSWLPAKTARETHFLGENASILTRRKQDSNDHGIDHQVFPLSISFVPSCGWCLLFSSTSSSTAADVEPRSHVTVPSNTSFTYLRVRYLIGLSSSSL